MTVRATFTYHACLLCSLSFFLSPLLQLQMRISTHQLARYKPTTQWFKRQTTSKHSGQLYFYFRVEYMQCIESVDHARRPNTYLPQCLCERQALSSARLPASYGQQVSWGFLIGLCSCCNNCCQDSQLFILASQGLLPVILSGIKYCDSQQDNSTSSTVERANIACVGTNLIIQNHTYNNTQYVIVHVMKSSRLSPYLCTV